MTSPRIYCTLRTAVRYLVNARCNKILNCPSSSPRVNFKLEHAEIALPLLGHQFHFVSTTKANLDTPQVEENEEELDATTREGNKNQVPIVDVHTSMRYLRSKAYQTTYGTDPVWKHYRRNFKGAIAPPTRRTCIRRGVMSTGNPCPICRDEYLILDYRNVQLLEQFVSPFSGAIHDSMKTGLCQRQQKRLVVAVLKARNIGLLEMAVPFREYNVTEYLEERALRSTTHEAEQNDNKSEDL